MISEVELPLFRGETYAGGFSGRSMRPLLHSGRDLVIIASKPDRLRKYDVALYKRKEDYILHRVIEVNDSGYIIRGDNCYSDECVSEECVIGVMIAFIRRGKLTPCTDKKYLRYVYRRMRLYPVRLFFKKSAARFGRIFRRACFIRK